MDCGLILLTISGTHIDNNGEKDITVFFIMMTGVINLVPRACLSLIIG